MSSEQQSYGISLPLMRTVCLPKRVCWAMFTYAPPVSFALSILMLPGHIILFPYYILVILARGRPPRFLYGWVYLHSAYLYGAIHEKDFLWKDFACLWFIYFGYLIEFIRWLLTAVSLALVFTIFVYIEEWELLTKATYRITFGYWKKLVTNCPEMRGKTQKRKQLPAGEVHEVEVETVKVKKGESSLCPVCGESIDPTTLYCPKCGSYVKSGT